MAGESGMDHTHQLAEVLEKQRIYGDMTDVVVVCREKEFQAHKMILCATSPYFKTLLKPEWGDNKNGRIELPTVSGEVMEIILPFLYTGKVNDVNDPDLIKNLLTASHMLQIDGLFEYCYKKLFNDLNCDNFSEMFKLTYLYNHSGMTELVMTFLKKHILSISKHKDFLQLTLHQVLKIVQNVHINDDIIEGLLKWAEVEEQREASLLHIFTSVDLQNITTDYLMKLLRERTLVKKNFHVLTILNAEATARMYFESVKEYNLYWCGEKDARQFYTFDIKQNSWLKAKILPFNLEYGMATVSFGEHVYFVGGGESPSYIPSAQVIKYNPATNGIVSEEKLSIPVCLTNLGVLLSSIYVVNGLNNDKTVVRTVQRYNPSANTCEALAQTNNAHYLATVLTFSSYLYVVGSWNKDNSVERYEHETNAWTVITNIPGTIHWYTAAIFTEKLFVNPSRNSNELQLYDFQSKTWTAVKIAGLTESIYGLYSTTSDGKSILLIRDDKNVVHFCDEETKQLVRKSPANEEPCHSWQTCIT